MLWMSVETAMVALYASPVPENPNKAGIAMAIAALLVARSLMGPGSY